MWRWIIRIWVSVVVFWMLMFIHGAAFVTVARLMTRMGLPLLTQIIHSHALLSLFLLGVVAGQIVLGSNITGRGWFRSKSGLTYEGFKLEEIKAWTWLIVSPILLLGIVAWMLEQTNSGVLSNLSFENFYQYFLMPNCSNIPLRDYQFNPPCGMQILFVGSWMASLGYSIAPVVRKRGMRFLRSLGCGPKATGLTQESSEALMKEKAELK